MVKYNPSEDHAVRILLRPGNIKRIGITCKCGMRTQHVVPKILVDGLAQVVIDCPGCQQSYGVMGEKIIRLDKDFMPDDSKGSPFIKEVQQAPIVNTDSPEKEVKSDVETIDADIPFIPGSFRAEGSEHVN